MTQLNLTSQEKAQLEQLGLPLSNYGNRGLLAIDGNTITATSGILANIAKAALNEQKTNVFRMGRGEKIDQAREALKSIERKAREAAEVQRQLEQKEAKKNSMYTKLAQQIKAAK
jgi:hypothetical protein